MKLILSTILFLSFLSSASAYELSYAVTSVSSCSSLEEAISEREEWLVKLEEYQEEEKEKLIELAQNMIELFSNQIKRTGPQEAVTVKVLVNTPMRGEYLEPQSVNIDEETEIKLVSIYTPGAYGDENYFEFPYEGAASFQKVFSKLGFCEFVESDDAKDVKERHVKKAVERF